MWFRRWAVRPISRPDERQRIVYMQWSYEGPRLESPIVVSTKWTHWKFIWTSWRGFFKKSSYYCLKLCQLSKQILFSLLIFVFFFSEGRKHDAGMLADSGLPPTACFFSSVHLQTPFRHVPLAPLMQDYNETMSALRISVEWLFGDVINSFKFLDYKKNLEIRDQLVKCTLSVCALLRNAIACLYGNTTSDYFGVEPPTLEQYFQ